MNEEASSSLKGDGLLAKNTLINFSGQAIPLVFAAAAIPFVIGGLGTERFGVLTIVWIIIGYFGLFDMGIGRATTKFVADFEAEGKEQLTSFIFTSISLLTALGMLVSFSVYFATPWVVNDVLNIPASLVQETEDSFYILCISIPFVLGSVGARGALEARQRFDIVNFIKIPASILNYVSPLLILPFTNRLQPIIMVLVAGRCCTFFLYAYFNLQNGFDFSPVRLPIFRWIKKLLSFGAWIMVSNFISPLMVYMDRFILGSMLTMTAVAYYTTPYEVVTRLWIISGSFMGVMFPAFSVYSLSKKEKLVELHQKSIRFILFVMVPITTFIVLGAYPILYFWLGSEFAVNSSVVLQLLGIGVFVNSIASVPYTVLQAIGRPDITAKLHMAELPIYLAMIWYLAYSMGIEGVALAWMLRVSIDCLLLLYFGNRFLGFKINPGGILKTIVVSGVILLACTGIFLWITNIYVTLIYAAVCAIIALYIAWKFVLKAEDRRKICKLDLRGIF